jgi:hypothetical protein
MERGESVLQRRGKRKEREIGFRSLSLALSSWLGIDNLNRKAGPYSTALLKALPPQNINTVKHGDNSISYREILQ